MTLGGFVVRLIAAVGLVAIVMLIVGVIVIGGAVEGRPRS